MWKQKIGISLGNHYEFPTNEMVDLVSRVVLMRFRLSGKRALI